MKVNEIMFEDIFSTFMGATLLGAGAWMAFDTVKRISNMTRDYVTHRKSKKEYVDMLVDKHIISNDPKTIKRAMEMLDNPVESERLMKMARDSVSKRLSNAVAAKVDKMTLDPRNEVVTLRNEICAILAKGKQTSEDNVRLGQLVDNLHQVLDDPNSYAK